MKLRPYQNDFCNAVQNEWRDVRSTVGVMFTGLGKTVCFAELIKRFHPKRALVVAHREELIFQARDKILEHTGLHMEVEMGDYKASAETGLFQKSSGIVSSVQTLTSGGDGLGRMAKFDPMDFDLLVTDEAHHATSASYRRYIDYFLQNPNLKHLGVTATPDRADEEALGQVFESVAFEYEAEDAIRDGWLVPVDQQFACLGELDFSQIRTTAGDLNQGDLAAVMEAEKPLYGVADASVESIGNKRFLAFCASVNHARMLSEIFNRYRNGMCAWVSGKTDKEDRRRILSEFAAGKIQGICNCGVFTEGTDLPFVEIIIMAKPTKSRALYAQMLGRGLRPLPGIVDNYSMPVSRRTAINRSPKPSCIVLDFAGNSGKHKLVTAADVLGGKVSDEAIERAVEFAKRTGKPMRVGEMLDDEEQKIQEEREAKRIAEEARRAKLTAKVNVAWQKVDAFNLLQIKPQTKERAWDDGKTFSEKQAAFLKRNGIDPATITYGQGKQLMAVMGQRRESGLCTLNQMKTLRKYGVNTDAVTYEHAHKIIDAIAANGWRKPSMLPSADSKPEPVLAGKGDDNIPF